MGRTVMPNIEVVETSPNSFSVTVHGHHVTVHQVSVKPEYVQGLIQPQPALAALVGASFAFLLDHESNSSILRSFDLSIIERYFPDYPKAIASYLSS